MSTQADWLFVRFLPFLKKLSRDDGKEALLELVEMGYLTKEQLEGITRLWAASHQKKANGTKKH